MREVLAGELGEPQRECADVGVGGPQLDTRQWSRRSIASLRNLTDEAAGLTGLSRDLLYDQMRAGKLAHLKVGRRRIITRQHLEAFLTRRVS